MSKYQPMMTEAEQQDLIDSLSASPHPVFHAVLPDGTFAYLMRLTYTWGLHLGCDRQGLTYRFCFSTMESGLAALRSLQTYTDIPTGDWIACRPANRLPQPCFFDDSNHRLTFDEAWKKGFYSEETIRHHIEMLPGDKGLEALLRKRKEEPC